MAAPTDILSNLSDRRFRSSVGDSRVDSTTSSPSAVCLLPSGLCLLASVFCPLASVVCPWPSDAFLPPHTPHSALRTGRPIRPPPRRYRAEVALRPLAATAGAVPGQPAPQSAVVLTKCS